MKRFILFLPFLLFALIAFGFWFGLRPSDDTLPSALAGKPLPEFKLEGLVQPEALSAQTLRDQDSVLLVNFFASWCVPCKAEHPLLVKLAERDDIKIIGISYKNKRKDAERFLERLGNPYALTGYDLDGRVAIEWGVYGVPETYIVSKDGRIIDRIAEAIINPTGQAKLKAALGQVGIAL